jgi:3-oxoacyl-[acyl-carrier protein] reductase
MSLVDKVFIITGGSSGLGKAFAHELIVNFAEVIITGRDKKKLIQVAEDLGCHYFHADVTKDEDIDALMNYALSHFNQLDGIINNAGIGGWSSLEELSRDKMREVYEVNVFGAAMMAAKAAVIFKKQNFGTIVNIASTAAINGYKNGTIYASSKFALRGMSQCWLAELRPYNVRVIQINPSEVPTAFGQTDRIEKVAIENKLSPKEIADVLIASLKMDGRGFIPEVSIFATNPF